MPDTALGSRHMVMPTNTDAWILDDSPGSYRWGSIDLPELAADEVHIRVRASALNHMDLWVTKGMPRPPLPHVPGCDVAGVVEAVGPAVTNVAVKLGGLFVVALLVMADHAELALQRDRVTIQSTKLVKPLLNRR